MLHSFLSMLAMNWNKDSFTDIFCFLVMLLSPCGASKEVMRCSKFGEEWSLGGVIVLGLDRAVARILFQPRQRGKLEVWGRSPQWGPGAEPLIRGSGGEARLKLKAF